MRPPEIRLYDDEVFADVFAGGGGTSTGIEAALNRSPHYAINHNAEALAMHAANHPNTIHVHSDVRDVAPRRLIGKRHVGFAWFSPDCTYHSKARGGKPFRDRNKARRVRGLANEAIRWAKDVRPRIIFVENVEEFRSWGPLDDEGRIIKDRAGEFFARWVSTLRNLGYIVEWRELRACDFGAPTSRKRLFVIARCDGRPIVWPPPTHGHGRPRPHRTAAECIDWSIPIPSIFLTKKEAEHWARVHRQQRPKRPLSENTQARIARGIERFVLNTPEPYIVNVRHTGHEGERREYSLHEPLRTIPASDREVALVTPFVARIGQTGGNGHYVNDIREPVTTVTTKAEHLLVAPTLVQTSYGERHGRHGEQAPRVLDLHAPLGTIVAQGIKHSLVAAFLAKHNAGHEATGQMVMDPVAAVTTRDSKALVTSHLVRLRGTSDAHIDSSAIPVTEPVPTVSASGNHVAEVRAFLVKFYGTCGHGQDAQLPLGSVTTRDRFGLVTVWIDGEEYFIADIGMRMLTPRELFRATGFPEGYKIDYVGGRRLTKKAQTRMVGNAVPPDLARALVAANYLEAA